MMNNTVQKDVKYTARDFGGLKANLVEFARNYFPNTINDFSDSSPSTMYIEMAAYVGDVLSYYTDYAMKETMLHRASEKANIYSIAQAYGYKPKLSTPSTTTIRAYALIPATGTSGDVKPHWAYAPKINAGMIVSDDSGIQFKVNGEIDFAHSSSSEPIDITLYSSNATTGLPEYYLVSKDVLAMSGESRTTSFNVGNVQEYAKFIIADNNVQSVDSIIDSDGMDWVQVPFLAQETVFDETINSVANNPALSDDAALVPYVLRLKTVKRRFTTRITPNDKVEIRFGGGISTNPDESFIPNPENIGSNLPGSVTDLDKSFDPSNFLYTDTYGQAPANTTLLVNYRIGYGLSSNVGAGTVKNIVSKTLSFNPTISLIPGIKSAVQNSIYVDNITSAVGGMGSENKEQVRRNAIGYFSTQNRIVTKEDYIIRTLSLPSKFGNITKAYIATDEQMLDEERSSDNPLAVNLYVLTYDKNKKLVNTSTAAKENLRTYLSQYRILTDAINIKNGYVVNIGLDFEISTLAGNNSNQVLIKCIQKLKEMFHIDNLTFKTPIFMADIATTIAGVEGVQSVISAKVLNKTGGTYSPNVYNLEQATYNGVIYPSLDPSIFEIKNADEDIKGRVVSY